MPSQTPQVPEDVNDSSLYRAYRLLLCLCDTGVLSRACERTGLLLPTASRLSARARAGLVCFRRFQGPELRKHPGVSLFACS